MRSKRKKEDMIMEPPSKSAKTETELHINDLPPNLLIEIFKRLTLQQKVHVSLVCKHWHAIAFCPDLWREIRLSSLPKLYDSTVLHLTTFSENVTHLDISDSRFITSSGFVEITRQCRSLQFLNITRFV